MSNTLINHSGRWWMLTADGTIVEGEAHPLARSILACPGGVVPASTVVFYPQLRDLLAPGGRLPDAGPPAEGKAIAGPPEDKAVHSPPAAKRRGRPPRGDSGGPSQASPPLTLHKDTD